MSVTCSRNKFVTMFAATHVSARVVCSTFSISLLCFYSTMNDSWTQEESIDLISKYREKSLLWGSRDQNHFNKTLRGDAWSYIANQLEKSVNVCKKKMVSILAALRRGKAKMKKSMGTCQGPPQTDW
ncbi:hypothetical protein J6590_078252 [Homalodisca vitripennis]|nr:hypothetical protein J6590_078252 [Homalodisca vitripennis]